MKPGDHAIVWRERFLYDEAKNLLGKRVVITKRITGCDMFSWASFDLETGVFRGTSSTVRYNVVCLEDGIEYCNLNPKAMTQVSHIECISSWNDCAFVPAELKNGTG